MAQKVDSNLYRYNDTTYLVAINKKNIYGEQVVINQYFSANNDNDAINFKNKLLRDNNLIKSNKTTTQNKKSKGQKVSKYIYKYGKDYYRIRIKKNKLFPDGFDEYVNGELKEVEEYRDKIIAQVRVGKSPISKYRNMTVEQFKKEFMDKYCYDNIGEVTADDYDRMLTSFIVPKFSKYKMYEIENMTPDIQKFINDLKTTPNKHKPAQFISSKYQNSIYNVFNLMLNVAVSWNAIAKNPMSSIKPPKFKTKKTKIYNLDEMYNILDKLFENEEIREKFMITLFVCSGIRKGELVGLHIDNFNFDENYIKVEWNVVSTKRKGTTHEKETKTDNGERIIYLPPFVMNLAKVYFKYREEQISMFVRRYGADYKAPDNIFLSRFGKIMHPDTPYKIWTNFRDKYALGEVTPHGLRHSWCTAEYHENEYLTEKELAILMGHGANIKMTDHYTHEDQNKLKQSARIFERYQSKLDKAHNNLYTLDFVETATILSGRLYTDSSNIIDMLKNYYKLESDPSFKEVPKLLLDIRNSMLDTNEKFVEIKDFINDNNNDWEVISRGTEKYGNKFDVFDYNKTKQLKTEKDNNNEKNIEIS